MSSLQKGFTLVEIMIVTTIVVLLGIILLVGLNPLTQIFKSYDTIRKADLEKLRAAFESYYEDHLCYPGIGHPFEITVPGKYGVEPSYVCGDDVLSPYIDSMPCDPNTNQPYNIYLEVRLASEKTCPTNFAIYAKLTNLFDPSGHIIPWCDNKAVVGNSGVRTSYLSSACNGGFSCTTYWGCTSPGSNGCTIVSYDSPPSNCKKSACNQSLCNSTGCDPDDMCD